MMLLLESHVLRKLVNNFEKEKEKTQCIEPQP